jgi:hypothetical protein
MSVYKTYTPLKIGEGYRTYANIEDGLYKIFLDENVKREFTDATLPNEIKVIVGLINAYDWEKIHQNSRHTSITDQPSENYAMVWMFDDAAYPPVLIDIGWRYKQHYCLVLPTPLFQELRGGMTMSE